MLRPGDEPVPGYRLEEFLGKGQYGEVSRARSPGGAKAALKFLDLGGRAGWKEFRAIQRVKAIRHANLMPITALWVLDDEGRPVDDSILDSFSAAGSTPQDAQDSVRATMHFNGGPRRQVPRQLVVASLLGDRNLLQLLEDYQSQGQGGIPVEELLPYMEQAAKGIDFLNMAQHDLGQGPVAIQHCDIKPENIMLVGDSVLVCDFGLASVLADARSAATATGMVGSLAYMSPECASRKPSVASDQYSLAISYVELRTGDLPFINKSFAEVLDAVRHSKLDFSKLSPGEQKVLRRATSLMPGDRYPTASAMVADLRRVVNKEVVPPGVPQSKSVLPALFAALAVGGVAVGIAAVLMPGRAPIPGPPPPKSYTIVWEPADVPLQLQIDDQSIQPTEPGRYRYDFDETGTRTVTATPAPDSGYVAKTETLQKNRDHQLTLRLEHSARWLQQQAYSEAKSDWDQGVRTLVAAIQAGDRQADPSPRQLPASQTWAKSAEPIERAQWTPDERYLLVTNEKQQLQVWDLEQHTEQPIATHEIAGDVGEQIAANAKSAVLSYDHPAKHVALGFIRNFLDASSSPITYRIDGNIRPKLAMGDEIATAAVAEVDSDGKNYSRIFVFHLQQTGQPEPLKSAPVAGTNFGIELAPDSTSAATLQDEQVHFWRLSPTDAPVEQRIANTRSTTILSLPKSNQFIIDNAIEVPEGNDVNSRVRYQLEIRDWNDAKLKRVLPEPTDHSILDDSINAIATDRDEKWLAASTPTGQIAIWPLDTPASDAPRILIGPKNQGDNLCFAPKSGWLLTYRDNQVALWNFFAKTLTPIILFEATSGDDQVVRAHVLHNDRILVILRDGRIMMWDFLPWALLRDAQEIVGAKPSPVTQP